MEELAKKVAEYYGKRDLGAVILAGLEKMGKDLDNLKPKDIEPVDAFHIRGREASIEMAGHINFNDSMHVLDVGSGVGGASRYLASTYGCKVTGLDLTEEYCRAAQLLTDRIGLGEHITYRQGDGLDMPFEDETFDVVWTQHAAMNIADKAGLYAETHRVLKPGGILAIFDIVAGPGGPVLFPVPWAVEPSISFLVTAGELRDLLRQTGFQEVSWRNTSEECRQWFQEFVGKIKKMEEPPPLGFHLLVGPNFKAMALNQVRNLDEERIELIETVVRRS